jgi:DNA primase
VTLSPAWLDELRARTTLSAIISPHVKLVRAGREWKACCPFHNEKTPSFTVNDDKHFYHCFGCGAHGDAIRFLTDHRGLPFMDAVKELAAKAGMEVPAPDPRAKERSERTSSLTEVTEAAQRWFAEQLQGIAGAEARDYCKRRGIGPETIEQFGIGLAPDTRGALKAALASLGEDRLIETGMLIRPEEPGKASYDRFRGRLMFPVRDARGRVIAFGGRILGDGEPKYLNSPDTPLFDKGRTLYNLDRAGPASRKAGRLIVVEGYMDVIALDRAGIAEAVAPNGTAVTEAQLERLWRLDPAPILCFDGDAAGRKAAIRAALRALPHLAPDKTLRFVELPAGQDPDDLVRAAMVGQDGAAQQNAGRDALEALLATPEPLDERLWRHEVEAHPLTTPEARAGLKQRLVEHSRAIHHADLSRIYREQWLERFDREIMPRRQFQPRAQDRGPWRPFKPFDPPVGSEAKAIGHKGIDPSTARSLLVGLINFPEALPQHAEELAALPFADPGVRGVRDDLLDRAYSGQALDRDQLVPIFDRLGVKSGTSSRNAVSFSFTRADTVPERALADLSAAFEMLTAAEEVDKALNEATERLKRDFTDEALAEQQRLIAAQQGLRERLAQLAGTD